MLTVSDAKRIVATYNTPDGRLRFSLTVRKIKYNRFTEYTLILFRVADQVINHVWQYEMDKNMALRNEDSVKGAIETLINFKDSSNEVLHL